MHRPLLDGPPLRPGTRRRALLPLGAAFVLMAVTLLACTHHTKLHSKLQSAAAAATATQQYVWPEAQHKETQHQHQRAKLEAAQLQELAANVSGILSTAEPAAADPSATSAQAQQLQQQLLRPESLTAAAVASLTAAAAEAAGGGHAAGAAAALESQIQAAQGAILQAIAVLSSAGVQLDVLQMLQLDRLRMKWELHGRGRLQWRREALAAQLAAARPQPAAAATAPLQATSSAADGPDGAAALTPQHHQQWSGPNSMRSTGTQPPAAVSRGILIVAGSRQQMANALVSIMVLRQSLNCSLPVEVVFYGPAEYDPLMARILSTYNVSQAGAGSIFLVDGQWVAQQLDLGYHNSSWAVTSSDGTGGSGSSSVMGFAAKAHALAYVTSFQQVLLLDADSLPLVNPEELFDSEPFASAGNLFWPDFWLRLWIHPEIFRKLGQPVPWDSEPMWKSAESGQVLLDRLRHVDVLEWLWWINSHNNITYAFMHGDKDTWRLAFSLADKVAAHRQVAMPARDALSFHNASTKEMPFKHQGMVQHSPGREQKPAFLHRTDHSKFFPDCAALSSSSDCHVAFFTSPLTEGQAMLAMQQGMRFPFDMVDLEAYQQECRSDMPVNPDRPDDPARCKGLMEGQNIQPVPMIPIHAFSNVQPVLYQSYLSFKRVKALLDIGERQEEQQLQQQQARAERRQQLKPPQQQQQWAWPSSAMGDAAGRAEPMQQGRPVARPKAAQQAAGSQQQPQRPEVAAVRGHEEDLTTAPHPSSSSISNKNGGGGVGSSDSSSTSSSTSSGAVTNALAADTAVATAGTASSADASSTFALHGIGSSDDGHGESDEQLLSSSRPLPSAVAAVVAANAEPPGDESDVPLVDRESELDVEGGRDADDDYVTPSSQQQQMRLQRQRAVEARRQQLLQQPRLRLLAPFP